MNELVVPTLTVRDGEIFADSRDVSSFFGKEHRRVLQDIRELCASLVSRGLEPGLHGLVQSTYPNEQGREFQKFDLTKDGFTLLVMRYTGDRALDFQLAYIAEFNRMRSELDHLRAENERLLRSQILALENDAIRRTRSHIETSARTLADFERSLHHLRELSQRGAGMRFPQTVDTESLAIELEIPERIRLDVKYRMGPFIRNLVTDRAVAEFYNLTDDVADRILLRTLGGRSRVGTGERGERLWGVRDLHLLRS